MLKAFKDKIKTRLGFCPQHYDFLPTHLALSQRPPSPFARYTAIMLSVGIIIALLWAYLGKLDVQATATGRLIVSGRSQIIQAYEQSRVTAIHVQNGQQVIKDTPLLTLDTLGVNQDIARLLKQIEYQVHEKIRYQALTEEQEPAEQELFQTLPISQQTQIIENYSREKREYEAGITNLKAEMNVNLASQQARKSDINALTKLRQNISQRLKARQTLSEKQVISKVEYLEQEKEFLETERLIAQQSAELNVLQSQYINLEKRLNSLKTQKEREWFDKRKQAEVQLVVLEQELSKAQVREQLEVIRSPVTGTVQQLSVHTLGAVLQPAQNLMVIVPDDDVQLAEVQILNKDAGFVYPGQQVTVKVDAFPYTRYGTIDGELMSISRDSTTDEQLGLVFPAQVSLKSSHIVIDNTSVEITPGMSIVAEIKTDQRRVIDYLLSPIREYQSEALREK
ncbi:HlyD family type I secretion periplasmic adaptor subunit [Photorhabdus heterorhabditis]|uniref:Membrane fusion protein (MFP) family protein n=1 Tax=Photorhabdus heterorhabditis TaxID=880156 RepID=A0A5B0WUB6_9GAMM|nr:HlyD family type I secretion periplasmic adaptor subunit [Photorhabdus heterorhabditis]KAA1190682.1 HlyD family type I secretion periplasmic adaptor subunit [Photorhabdus heterorhabditis]KOY63109.1 hemolysin D [Photorhabdus heterorhabditis]MBS9442152.1 HlyD family type I secretion periplasmic adaptor subunit [Photorhabdus heterorhabditis]